MQKILTKSEILDYSKKGIRQISMEEMPLMTDLAREELSRLGMEIVLDAETPNVLPPPAASGNPALQKMLQSLAHTPTYGMVRIPTLSYEMVTVALDIGAGALLIPQIRTVEDITRLKSYSHYPPLGRRGVGPSRLWEYGDSIGRLGEAGDINRTINIVIQLETVSAVENIDGILAESADFVDMFFIGPGDLSMDMGIFAGNFQAAESWFGKGFDMVIINSELALLGTAVSQAMPGLRAAIGEKQ